MADFEIPKHGEICWRELSTKDLAAAETFYSTLFDWNIEQSKVTPMPYREIVIDGKAVGAMMEIDEKWGPNPPPSHWTAYIAVDDADETAAKILEFGGTLTVAPFDAPGVGRIAIVAEPSGAKFAIIQFATAHG
jgi:uncharacterized protein